MVVIVQLLSVSTHVPESRQTQNKYEVRDSKVSVEVVALQNHTRLVAVLAIDENSPTLTSITYLQFMYKVKELHDLQSVGVSIYHL